MAAAERSDRAIGIRTELVNFPAGRNQARSSHKRPWQADSLVATLSTNRHIVSNR
jgi:hypothetical protein